MDDPKTGMREESNLGVILIALALFWFAGMTATVAVNPDAIPTSKPITKTK